MNIEELKKPKYILKAETGEISQIPINTTFKFKLSEKGYGQGFYEGQMKERKYWQDKIKSKIEKLENEKEKYFEKQVIQHEIEVLQSLLEKE